MTLSEVAAVTGLTRAGARRILLTLEHLGYVTVDDRKFALTPRILELGYAYLSGTPLWNLALPYMEEVAEQTRESCSVSVLEGGDIVYILRLSTHKVMTINLAVGSRLAGLGDVDGPRAAGRPGGRRTGPGAGDEPDQGLYAAHGDGHRRAQARAGRRAGRRLRLRRAGN